MFMTITEQSRLNLYDSVRTHHGEEVAVTLMEMLPPVGWADIATKDDVRHQIEMLRKTIDSKMHEMFGRQLKWTVGTMIAMQACTFGLLKMV